MSLSYATCSVCNETFHRTLDGKVCEHGSEMGKICPGSGEAVAAVKRVAPTTRMVPAGSLECGERFTFKDVDYYCLTTVGKEFDCVVVAIPAKFYGRPLHNGTEVVEIHMLRATEVPVVNQPRKMKFTLMR